MRQYLWLVFGIWFALFTETAWAQSSQNYALRGPNLNAGGTTQMISANYGLSTTLGQGSAVGSAASVSYQGWCGAQYAYRTTAAACQVGDLDCNGAFNILDLQRLINCIFGNGSCTQGDLNGDGSYNILDLQRLINKIFGK